MRVGIVNALVILHNRDVDLAIRTSPIVNNNNNNRKLELANDDAIITIIKPRNFVNGWALCTGEEIFLIAKA